MVVLPLWTQARQVGVLLLEGDAPHDFSRREIRPYLSLLGQLTVAVENQRLYEQTQQRAAELALAKDAAEMASRAKSDFLASMSHELRTPLNGILGYAQILKRDGRLAPPQANAVKIIQDSGEHLLTLINDILDLAKIEARKLELNLTDFQFSHFLEGIIGMFSLRAQQKETVRFAYEAVTDLPTVIRADEKRLRQILLNLLSNALKFTDTGQVVFQVGAVRHAQQEGSNGVWRPQPGQSTEQFQPGQLRFAIIDTGIGISPQQLEKIFLPFEQACEPARRAEGTGLGLAITQNLVEAMGGNLQVNSTPGQGSHFSLEVKFPMLWSPVDASVQSSHPWRPPQPATAFLEEELTPPPPEELAILLDLAMKGEIRALKRRVSHVEQLDEKFKPFARKLSQFVKKYDEVQILALIGKYAG
ncbi:MAG: hypothetical protein KDF65_03155 [Anaerolineae bacterium]|nr:hypothetical protein [Anaerolineae bacterium]